MSRKLTVARILPGPMGRALCFFVLAAGLIGCSPGESFTVEVNEAAVRAAAIEQASDDVAESLTLVQDLADHFTPLVGASTFDQLRDLALEAGCELTETEPGRYWLSCESLLIGGRAIDITSTVELYAGDTPVTDAAQADRFVFHGDASGDEFYGHYHLSVRVDGDLGIVAEGDLTASVPGLDLFVQTDDLVVRLIADSGATGYIASFVSGNLDIVVRPEGGDDIEGSVAISGSKALVSLGNQLIEVDLR